MLAAAAVLLLAPVSFMSIALETSSCTEDIRRSRRVNGNGMEIDRNNVLGFLISSPRSHLMTIIHGLSGPATS